jgi:hypothetical protein
VSYFDESSTLRTIKARCAVPVATTLPKTSSAPIRQLSAWALVLPRGSARPTRLRLTYTVHEVEQAPNRCDDHGHLVRRPLTGLVDLHRGQPPRKALIAVVLVCIGLLLDSTRPSRRYHPDFIDRPIDAADSTRNWQCFAPLKNTITDAHTVVP